MQDGKGMFKFAQLRPENPSDLTVHVVLTSSTQVTVGMADGNPLGIDDGVKVGVTGCSVGDAEGVYDGITVGMLDGSSVGGENGVNVGDKGCSSVGDSVGVCEGVLLVGSALGCSTTNWVCETEGS